MECPVRYWTLMLVTSKSADVCALLFLASRLTRDSLGAGFVTEFEPKVTGCELKTVTGMPPDGVNKRVTVALRKSMKALAVPRPPSRNPQLPDVDHHESCSSLAKPMERGKEGPLVHVNHLYYHFVLAWSCQSRRFSWILPEGMIARNVPLMVWRDPLRCALCASGG